MDVNTRVPRIIARFYPRTWEIQGLGGNRNVSSSADAHQREAGLMQKQVSLTTGTPQTTREIVRAKFRLANAVVLMVRALRVDVLPGNMPYSAVNQPLPEPARNGGTLASTQQVQSTVVRPMLTRTLPGA